MKTIKRVYRASSILKMAGVTIVLISLFLWLYAAIDKYWDKNPIGEIASSVSKATSLQAATVKAEDSTVTLTVNDTIIPPYTPSVADWLSYDDHYFTALSKITTNAAFKAVDDLPADTDKETKKAIYKAANADIVKPYFSRYFDAARACETVKLDKQYELELQRLEESFDPEAFVDRFGQMEEILQQHDLEEMFAYIDGLQVTGKGPKGKAIKPATLEPNYRALYDSLVESYGEEETGSWYEFVSSVYRMIKDTPGTVNPKTWLEDGFNWDEYKAQLTAVREEERTEERTNIILEMLNYCERRQAGEDVALSEVVDGIYANLLANYPDEAALRNKCCYLLALESLLESKNFNGSYASLRDATLKQDEIFGQTSVDKAEADFIDRVLEAGYKREDVRVVSAVWSITAKHFLLLFLGFALIVAAWLIKRILDRILLTKQIDTDQSEEKEPVAEVTTSEGGEDEMLLRVSHLKQYFRSGQYVNKAVDDISFFIRKGEVFGLVGESGCGKTTTGRTIIDLYDPTEGDVYFEGLRISSNLNGFPVLRKSLRNEFRQTKKKLQKEMDEKARKDPANAETIRQETRQKITELKQDLKKKLSDAETNALISQIEQRKATHFYRLKRQDELTKAYESEKDHLTGEKLAVRTKRYKQDLKVAGKDNIMTKMQMIFQDPIASINPRMTVREIIAEGLVIQGVKDKEYIKERVNEMLELVGLVREHADRYPHEFSGGQRQRIGIARAIIMNPDLIIADEPISALDVSIQAQVINLLNDLRSRMGLTIMFIAHNLSVVKYFSDRIAVMYYGKIVEMTTSDELFKHPLHPYTKSLLSAIPYPDPHYEKIRRRIEYNPAASHDYSVDKPSLREIRPGHFIYCNDAEFAAYQKELEQ